jgi:hypothetical protein
MVMLSVARAARLSVRPKLHGRHLPIALVRAIAEDVRLRIVPVPEPVLQSCVPVGVALDMAEDPVGILPVPGQRCDVSPSPGDSMTPSSWCSSWSRKLAGTRAALAALLRITWQPAVREVAAPMAKPPPNPVHRGVVPERADWRGSWTTLGGVFVERARVPGSGAQPRRVVERPSRPSSGRRPA